MDEGMDKLWMDGLVEGWVDGCMHGCERIDEILEIQLGASEVGCHDYELKVN